MDTFNKKDDGKPMVSLVEPKFIIGMAEVMTFGAKEHGIDNWKKAEEKDIRRVKDALLRHVLAYTGGEMIDKDMNLSHSYAIAINAMFLNYLLEK